MSSWGNNDNAANAPYWAVNSTIAPNNPNAATPTAANVALLYGNTTADVYTTGETIGLFAIDAQEIIVAESGLESQPKVAHTGWILETTGSGGRAGRVQTEVLVALSNVIGDGDAQTWANVIIQLTGPNSGTVTHGSANANTLTFSVSPTLTGNTAATLTYQWQVNNGVGVWVNMTNGSSGQPGGVIAANVTTPTLSVTPWNTTANGYVFRAVVTAADEGVVVNSSNAYITIM